MIRSNVRLPNVSHRLSVSVQYMSGTAHVSMLNTIIYVANAVHDILHLFK